ncbi:hypothetical protein NFI96_023099, partial [Prochilodus magdalenae]
GVICVSAGCTLEHMGKVVSMRAPTGGSVLLPCSCTDLHAKPGTLIWKKYNARKAEWEEISSESDQYRNRVQLVNDLSPGNLSLLISHLTEEDEGDYRCDIQKDDEVFISLTLKEPPQSLPFVPFALVTVIFLHIIVAVVYYTSRTKAMCVSAGCVLENRDMTVHITAHTGGFVLLPCYCTSLHTKPETASWRKYNRRSNTYEEISSESGQYRNRVQLFNDHSPGNLSLLISHLTEEDGGDYRCDVKDFGYTFVKLAVKGCTLGNRRSSRYITEHTGGSVLLPCYCTDLQTKPQNFTWKKINTNTYTWDEIPIHSDHRVQLFNDHSPGNLSLLISHLTEEDGGWYKCVLKKDEYKDIKLTVEGGTAPEPTTIMPLKTSAEPSTTVLSQPGKSPLTDAGVAEPTQSLPFVPFALVTVIFLHIIVAVVYYTSRTKGALKLMCVSAGCLLENNGVSVSITAHTGGSVLLPCYCTRLRSKPETFSWTKHSGNTWKVISRESGRYRNRVQLINDSSAGNLSLLISHLTEEDGGDYRCDVKDFGQSYVRLTVEGQYSSPTPNNPPELHFFIYGGVGGLLLLMVLGVVIYWRYKARRQEQVERVKNKEEQRRDQQTQDCSEVLYCTIPSEQADKAEQKQNDSEVLYARINPQTKRKNAQKSGTAVVQPSTNGAGTNRLAARWMLAIMAAGPAGCTLANRNNTLVIRAQSGESVLLPCSCTDIWTTPERFTWKKYTNKTQVILSQSDQYRNRVQLVNDHAPGNLSLLISHLTKKDGGRFKCTLTRRKFTLIRLIIKGCTLVNSEKTLHITVYTGGSILLPCSCTELPTKPEMSTWQKYDANRKSWEKVSSESGQYRNRVQLVNDHSPGNLSILISHLTEEDGGIYRCDKESGYTDIRLSFEGDVLVDAQTTLSITAHIGGSVLLPCYCPDLQTTPETLIWRKYRDTWEEISRESGQYRNRVQLFHDHSPGNLSLLISHLTEEDEGLYRCDVEESDYTDINLTVKGKTFNSLVPLGAAAPKQPLPFIPFALVTVIFLHIIVAVVYYTSRTKGCLLEDNGQVKRIPAYAGGSVLLPCYCTDPNAKPDKAMWKKININRNPPGAWEEISRESGQYRNRVQLFNDHSPGNLSLLISRLTEEDGGDYRCEVRPSGHIFVRLTVTGCVLQDEGLTKHITAYTGEPVLLPCYCAELYTTSVRFNWKTDNTGTMREISSESGLYRNRVQLFNDHSPGNLSLLITHLTEEDEGTYYCEAEGHKTIFIVLTVKVITEPPRSLPFVPFAMVAVFFLHIIVAVVYCTKRTKGCTLTEDKQTIHITSYIGQSALLPCYCTDPLTKPDTFTWKKDDINGTKWAEISSESGQYRNRVQLVNDSSPGNFSLLISHLTEEDGGDYLCDVNKNGHVYVRLKVK